MLCQPAGFERHQGCWKCHTSLVLTLRQVSAQDEQWCWAVAPTGVPWELGTSSPCLEKARSCSNDAAYSSTIGNRWREMNMPSATLFLPVYLLPLPSSASGGAGLLCPMQGLWEQQEAWESAQKDRGTHHSCSWKPSWWGQWQWDMHRIQLVGVARLHLYQPHHCSSGVQNTFLAIR